MALNKAQSRFYLGVIKPTNQGLSNSTLFEATTSGLAALDQYNRQRETENKPFNPDGGLEAYTKEFQKVIHG